MTRNAPIKDLRVLMENWNKHIVEANGLAGLNRSKVVQLLKRLSNDKEQDLPGGDGTNDAMPADGTDDDAVDVEDEDILDSGKELTMNDVMTVMNQLRNTGGLSFEKLGNQVLNQVASAVKKTVETLATRHGPLASEIDQDRANIEEVGKRILKRLEIAFEKLFEPRSLVNLQEVLKTIKNEERNLLNENKKLTITIRG